jgi:hypothetical protein
MPIPSCGVCATCRRIYGVSLQAMISYQLERTLQCIRPTACWCIPGCTVRLHVAIVLAIMQSSRASSTTTRALEGVMTAGKRAESLFCCTGYGETRGARRIRQRENGMGVQAGAERFTPHCDQINAFVAMYVPITRRDPHAPRPSCAHRLSVSLLTRSASSASSARLLVHTYLD